jgi:hypothetical protein
MIHNPEAPNSTLGNKTATCRPSGTNSNHLQHTVETRWYSSFLCLLDSDISFSLLGSEVISKNLTRTVLQNWNNDKWQLPPTIIRRIQVVLSVTPPPTGSLIGLVCRARKWPLPGPTKTRSASYDILSLLLFPPSRKIILWSRGTGR